MKRIITIGKPTHLRLQGTEGFFYTACGHHAGRYDHVHLIAAYDPRDVDCLRCMKTKKYKAAMR